MPAIEGFPDVRYWTDGSAEALSAELEKLVADGREAIVEAGGFHALAISGGADYGAFTAGILKGWTESGERPEFALVTGVSTGALIAFAGPEWDDDILTSYTTITAGDVAGIRLPGQIFEHLSLADSAPLREMLERHVTPELIDHVAKEHARGRRLWIGTTNMDARRPVTWDLGRIATARTEEARRLFVDIIMASAAVPVLLPPVIVPARLDGVRVDEMHADGGVTMNVFAWPDASLARVLDRDPTMARLPRRLYVIVNNKLQPAPAPVESDLKSIAAAAVGALTAWNTRGALIRTWVQARADGVEFRLARIPAEFDAGSGEAFDPEVMGRLAAQGRAMARSGEIWVERPETHLRSFAQD